MTNNKMLVGIIERRSRRTTARPRTPEYSLCVAAQRSRQRAAMSAGAVTMLPVGTGGQLAIWLMYLGRTAAAVSAMEAVGTHKAKAVSYGERIEIIAADSIVEHSCDTHGGVSSSPKIV